MGTLSEEHASGHDEDLTGHAGVDAFYRLTPNLTASLTINTDFAETEVDERKVNLTRFPLFFPEKRDFFLQDSGLFKFGGLGNDLIPFFSRRIGLSTAGEEVPILGGPSSPAARDPGTSPCSTSRRIPSRAWTGRTSWCRASPTISTSTGAWGPW
ncbi:MAG: hypothetical protein IPK67_00025 [Planctomycetes bacterium]|nr:hypothetical protein [Planctomycetota bacterium]